MQFRALNFIPPLVSFALALALTPFVRSFARGEGFVARPKIDRWHKNATATIGGIAIWLTVIGVTLKLIHHPSSGGVFAGPGPFLFSVDLTVNLLHIRPSQNLVGQ